MDVLVTGGTGYVGARLILALLARGHRVRALVRAGSERKLPAGAQAAFGNALEAAQVAAALRPGETLVHLVGVAHPGPGKEALFRTVDLASIAASAAAAKERGPAHLVYVSVAQPAPVMKAYVAARAEGEALVRATGIPATVLRPWYVLGPGHRWPYALLPFTKLLELLPPTRETARRLGFVTLAQMVAALVHAVETPPAGGTRIVEVPEIRAAGA